MAPIRYMSLPIVQSFYKDLNKKSDEDVVDKLWTVILGIYFTAIEDFAVTVQPRVDPKKTKKANDVTISYVHHTTSKRKALCLFEDKRVLYEGRASVWTDAKKQLTEYMTTQRKASKQEDDILYGVVTVGRYSRFYVLEPGKSQLVNYPGTNDDSIFEFKKHEAEIMEILLAIKSVVSRPSTPASQPGSGAGSNAGSRPASSAGSRPASSAGSRPGSRG